ncbi:MAG: ion transporter [Bacteroidota bacterium]|nr:ion transporter [Bacteroidota bacterium]
MKAIADSKLFNIFILFVIVAAGIVVGIETYKGIAEEYSTLLHLVDQLILWIFVAEAVIKIGSYGKKPWLYFKDPWNVFDFVIVAVCFMPVNAAYVAVLRLARILRAFKLVTALPKLQIIVGSLLKSIPSMGYIALLLVIHFYIYGVMGTFLFSDNDPVHFRNLQMSMLSLFRAVTLEDWTDLMYINMYGCDNYGYDGSHIPCTSPNAMPVASAIYFVSFIITGAMVVINLFIGVIIGGMDDMKEELKKELNDKTRREARSNNQTHEELALIEQQIEMMNENITQLKNHLKNYREKNPPLLNEVEEIVK